jgi:hypothetical protein
LGRRRQRASDRLIGIGDVAGVVVGVDAGGAESGLNLGDVGAGLGNAIVDLRGDVAGAELGPLSEQVRERAAVNGEEALLLLDLIWAQHGRLASVSGSCVGGILCLATDEAFLLGEDDSRVYGFMINWANSPIVGGSAARASGQSISTCVN